MSNVITPSTPSTTKENCFPLPMSPFERYMVIDDRRDYPMTFVLIARLKGSPVREVFEQSLNFSLNRHPLLKCLIGKVRGKGWCWIPTPELTPTIEWNERLKAPQAQVADQNRIDLTREIGLRIRVDPSDLGADILFQFHHACTDGLGGVQFIGDLLADYGRRTAPDGAELPEIAPVQIDRLCARTSFSTKESSSSQKSVSCPLMIGRRLFKLLRRGPVALAATKHSAASGTPLQFPAIISRVIDRSVLQNLKVVAARHGVELNDLYLLEMFQTIREWNRKHTASSDRRWLRIGMPTSLRTPDHDQMPAANIVSYMFLTRRASDCDRPNELLADIHRQTSRIVNHQQGRFLAFGLKYVLKIPGMLKCLLSFNSCFTTVILANVGDIRRQFTARFPLKQGRCVAGNVTLESLLGAAPVRPNTRLSTSLGTYAGNLYINMHCDPLSFTREQANELADLFVQRLKTSIPADVIAEQKAA